MPIGPAPPPPAWAAVQADADRVLEARRRGDARAVQCTLDAPHKHWADLAEKELSGTRQTTLPRWGSSGKLPQQRW
eukprot:8930925-Pyramimonas_sp.AAC.1